MVSYPGGHTGFVLAAIGTHAIIGATIGAVAFDRLRVGAIGGILPDVDLFFPATLGPPFVHRGITHTLLAAAVLFAMLAVIDRRSGGAVGGAYLSHLLLDATTPIGVPLAYPVLNEDVQFVIHGHSPVATVVILTICVLVYATRLLWPRAATE